MCQSLRRGYRLDPKRQGEPSRGSLRPRAEGTRLATDLARGVRHRRVRGIPLRAARSRSARFAVLVEGAGHLVLRHDRGDTDGWHRVPRGHARLRRGRADVRRMVRTRPLGAPLALGPDAAVGGNPRRLGGPRPRHAAAVQPGRLPLRGAGGDGAAGPRPLCSHSECARGRAVLRPRRSALAPRDRALRSGVGSALRSCRGLVVPPCSYGRGWFPALRVGGPRIDRLGRFLPRPIDRAPRQRGLRRSTPSFS